jgi:1-acyl-sn-glycerol-3-phosphate acyltransferase
LLLRIYMLVFCKLKIYGSKNVPKSGPFILAPNHSATGDPPFIGSCVNRELYFMAKKELFKNFFLKNLISLYNAFPVNRAILDKEAMARALEILKNGYGLTMFPEGTRSKTGDLGDAKPGIGMLARQAEVPILPVYAENTKGSIKLFFSKKRMTVRIGKIIPAEWVSSIENNNDGYRAIAAEVMSRIKAIKDNCRSGSERSD